MYAVTVTYSLRLGGLSAFLDAARDLAAEARAAGCLRTEVLSDPTRPGKAMICQHFPDPETFSAFRSGPAARAFDSRVLDVVTARTVATWSMVAVTAAERAEAGAGPLGAD